MDSKDTTNQLVHQGADLLRTRQAEAAIGKFSQALHSEPHHFHARQGLGMACAMQGDVPQAIAHLEAALEINRNAPATHYNLALLYQRRGRLEEAIEQLEAALRLAPDYTPAQQALTHIKAQPPAAAKFPDDSPPGRHISDPLAMPLQAKPVKSVEPTGDAYVDSCFKIEFPEYAEVRNINSVPEARALIRASNYGKPDEALRLAQELRRQCPDFYFSYLWLGHLRVEQQNYREARQVLQEGLLHSRTKLPLYRYLAESERGLHHLPSAVQWWMRSIVVQFSLQDWCDYNPFLYLSSIAYNLGLVEISTRLLELTDRIQPGGMRLPFEAVAELNRIDYLKATSIVLALEVLEDEFLDYIV